MVPLGLTAGGVGTNGGTLEANTKTPTKSARLCGLPLRQICAPARCAIRQSSATRWPACARRVSGLSYQFDSCMMASRSGETLVARKQRSVERFGKGDVDGIIGREIVPQIPYTRQK